MYFFKLSCNLYFGLQAMSLLQLHYEVRIATKQLSSVFLSVGQEFYDMYFDVKGGDLPREGF